MKFSIIMYAGVEFYFISADKLVKKVLHRTASGSLLAQSYLSTVLLFAGLYTLEFRFGVCCKPLLQLYFLCLHLSMS